MDRLIDLWRLLFPSLGGGWPELDVRLAEVGLGVSLPAPLRDLLIHARPPDREHDFRDVHLLDLDRIAWSSDESPTLIFGEMTDVGVQYGIDAGALRHDLNPPVVTGAENHWRPLSLTLTRWLEEYAYLSRLEAAPTTGWIRCPSDSVQRVRALWSAFRIDWNPLPKAERREPPFRGLRSTLQADVFVNKGVVIEVIDETDLVAAAPTLLELEAALGSIGVGRSMWSCE
jgi:hypothetical protein